MQNHDCVVSYKVAYKVVQSFHLFHIAITKERPVVRTYMEQGEGCCGIIDHKFLAIIQRLVEVMALF